MSENILSPVKGHIITLGLVPDEMFAKRMLGDGVAIIPEGEEWVSPVEGVVTLIYNTKHAIGITTNQGSEVLIHIGLDTYALEGKAFEMRVEVNDSVKIGDPLVRVDLDYIKKHGYNLVTPILITNKKIEPIITEGDVNAGDVLFQIIE